MHKRVAILAIYCLAIVGYAMAQSNPQNAPASGQAASQPAPQAGASASGNAPADAQAKPKNDDSADTRNPKTSTTAAPTSAPNHTPVSGIKIPSGSKIYVAPMGGFESYVVAGIMKKKVPVSIVADREKADFEIKGAAESQKAGWAKIMFMGNDSTNEEASINVTQITTGAIVFAYSVHKGSSVRGKQSAGEAIGKHLNEAIGKD
ncbi:MAG TPA: hypothetical protein VNZ47_09910 [Candidatus Dormibacteraeota bacterium]|jgi:hypothetical protein|nr:hypothetical protein [Candidatus Dormibacteraeota bacterium]